MNYDELATTFSFHDPILYGCKIMKKIAEHIFSHKTSYLTTVDVDYPKIVRLYKLNAAAEPSILLKIAVFVQIFVLFLFAQTNKLILRF